MTAQHLAVIGGDLDGEDPAGLLVISMANELAALGHKVTVLAFKAIDCEFDGRITLLTPPTTSSLRWLAMLRCRRWVFGKLAELQPDDTISMHSTLPGRIAVPLVGLLNERVNAANDQDAAIHERFARWMARMLPSAVLSRRYEKKAFSNELLEAVIALSRQIEDEVNALGLKPGATLQRASVPIVQHTYGSADRAVTRHKLARAWGLNPDAYWICNCFETAGPGGLEPMVRAFKPLVEQGVDAALLLAGPVRYTHLAWIAELGLRDRVRFVGKTGQVEQLIAASDLVACPTSYDPVGWQVLPALALGKRVITTAACGVAHAVGEQGGAVVSSPAEPVELLDAIRKHHADWQSGEEKPVRQGSPQADSPPLNQVVRALIQGGRP